MLKFKVTKDEDKNVTVTADRIGFKKLPFLNDDENEKLHNEVFRIADVCTYDALSKKLETLEKEDNFTEEWDVTNNKLEIVEKQLGYDYSTKNVSMLAVVVAVGLGFCKADTKSPDEYVNIQKLFASECASFYEKGEHKVVEIREKTIALFNEIWKDFSDDIDTNFKLDIKAWVIRWAIVNHRIVKSRTDSKTKRQSLEVKKATYKESFTLWCAMLCGAFGMVNLKDENTKKLYIG